MERIPEATPQTEQLPPEKEMVTYEMLESYLRTLQLTPSHTLDISQEELDGLDNKKRMRYQSGVSLLQRFHDRDQEQTVSQEIKYARLLAHLTEELLARRNALSQNWKVKGNPDIVQASIPDDVLSGVDFVASFSDNVACAIDVTLAKEGSAYQEKKRGRQQQFAESFRQVPLHFWRFPDGTIGNKEFPLITLHLTGWQIINFIKTSTNNIARPQETSFQNQYKILFANILRSIASSAETIAATMFEQGYRNKFLQPLVAERVLRIVQGPGKIHDKVQALNAMAERFPQDRTQKGYFDLLFKYYVIQSIASTVSKKTRRSTEKK